MKGRRQGNGKGHVKPRGHKPAAIRKRIRALEQDLARNPPVPATPRKRAPRSDPDDHLWNRLLPRLRDPVPRFTPGDSLILNGPAHGGWADSLPRRPWVVVECACRLCEMGTHVALDVPRSADMLELYPGSGLWRHVSSAALRRRGDLSRDRAEAWADAIAGQQIGQAFAWTAEDGRHDVHDAARRELSTLILADVLGGGALTDDQARQFEWWCEQRGGELTPEQLAQVREWQRARGPRP